MPFEPNRVPIFEPNQVLKNTDLNSIVTYLDSHNRLTRTHLIGMGIVCGLEVKAKLSTPQGVDEIWITAGCGITSEGFFVRYLPASDDTANQDRFTHYQNQSVAKNRLISGASKDEQFELKELISATKVQENPTSKEIHPLTDLTNIGQQVVLILCDWKDELRDSCLVDCDDRGRDRQFSLRFFLINPTQATGSTVVSAEELLRSGFEIDPPQSLESAFRSWFEVPDCHIDRPGYSTKSDRPVVDLTEIQTFDDLLKAYYRVCKAGILSLDAALQQTHRLFSPLTSTFQPGSTAFAGLRNRLRDLLISLVPIAIANADPFPGDTPPYVAPPPQVAYGIQYFYDYLVDLIAAFNELKDALFDLMDVCMPEMQRFPKYLLAGEVIPSTAECERPSLYRHSFYQPPIYNSNQRRKQEVRHLYERLLQMSQVFHLLPFYQTPVKVTPSRTREAPLGAQAIPFYYDYARIYLKWNDDACRKQRSAQLPAYFHLADRPTEHYPNERGYDLIPRIDWSNFFRVEGHVGLPLKEARDRIQQYKDDFNLAFDLVCVRLGKAGPQEDPSLKGYFDDLEWEFDRLKAQWKKQREVIEETIRDDTILLILKSLEGYFFKHNDLVSIDPGLMENDLLKQARNAANYNVQRTTAQTRQDLLPFWWKWYGAIQNARTTRTKLSDFWVMSLAEYTAARPLRDSYRLIVNFNVTPARIAFLPTERDGVIVPNTPLGLSLTDTGFFDQNRQRLIDTFVNAFSQDEITLQVVPDGTKVFRFVLRNGRENIELLEASSNPNRDLPNLLIALEDETPYDAQDLVERYHDFDALYTFLQYFVNAQSPKLVGIIDLVLYYEFRALFRRYLQRLEVIKKIQIFEVYAKQHRGLEHLGGVPRGGTLVLVYTGDAAIVNRLIASDRALLNSSEQRTRAISNQVRFPAGRLAANQQLAAATNDRTNQNVVIADFCLPYLCCSAYNVNYVTALPRPLISLLKSVFCANDSGIYRFVLDPPGGLLQGGDGIVDQAGQYAFQPSTVDLEIREPLNLTFFYTVNGVSSSFTVLMLPVTEVTLSIANGQSVYCVSSKVGQLIQFNATPAGGRFRLWFNNEPPPKDPNIQVSHGNYFDLATVALPTGQVNAIAHFNYEVTATDEYCGNTSQSVDIVLVRTPKIKIGYARNASGEAIGKLVYGSRNCADIQLRVEFRNEVDASEPPAESYVWRLNETPVADTANATIDIPYTSDRGGEVALTASNQYFKNPPCSETNSVSVKLPRLLANWKFGIGIDLPTRIDDENRKVFVLCRMPKQGTKPIPISVVQPGGTFTSEPQGLTVALRHDSLPCEQQTDYVMRFDRAKPGIYTLIYGLPDGSQFSQPIEVSEVPVGTFELDLNLFPREDNVPFLELRFERIQPDPGQNPQWRYEWQVTIGDRIYDWTTQRAMNVSYGEIRSGDLIFVIMRISDLNNICGIESDPKKDEVPEIPGNKPMRVIAFDFYQGFPNGQGQITWERIRTFNEDTNKGEITISGLGQAPLNIRAITEPEEVGSVVFALEDLSGQRVPKTTHDNRLPYDLYRNSDDTQSTVWIPKAGKFRLTAIPYQDGDGQGDRGTEKQAIFALSPLNQ